MEENNETFDAKTRAFSPSRLELLKDLQFDSTKKRNSSTRASSVGLNNNENERISSKINRILIQNTPTPLLNQKYSNRVKHLNDNNNNKAGESERKSLAKNKIFMVPNTPIFNSNNATQNSRRVI
jgi:hypothetical protein